MAHNIRKVLSYDPLSGEVRWIVATGPNGKAGAIAGTVHRGYRIIMLDKKQYPAHRVAWFLHHGSWPPNQIDHINGIRNDNRLVNLRLATHAQNQRNTGPYKSNKSGYKGVCWAKRNNRWMAQISFDGKNIKIGYFRTPEEAYAAYCAAAIKYHGEFANMGVVQ